MLVIANYAGCNVHLVSGIYVSHTSDINTEDGVEMFSNLHSEVRPSCLQATLASLKSQES